MRLLCALTVLSVPLLGTLGADGEDSACEDEIQVRRNTFYNVSLGEHIKIECPVKFCPNSKQTIFWDKLEGNKFTNASISSHVNVEFNRSSPLEGMSFLVFENIERNNSGFYQCRIGIDTVSFKIGVMVSDSSEVVTDVTSPQNATAAPYPMQNWSTLIRSVGFIAFAVVTTVVLYKTVPALIGSGHLQKPRDAADSRHQPPGIEFSSKHIYENDGLYQHRELSRL